MTRVGSQRQKIIYIYIYIYNLHNFNRNYNFDCYGVMVTQLTTFVPSISCNIILNMAVLAAKHVGKNIVNKIHHKL